MGASLRARHSRRKSYVDDCGILIYLKARRAPGRQQRAAVARNSEYVSVQDGVLGAGRWTWQPERFPVRRFTFFRLAGRQQSRMWEAGSLSDASVGLRERMVCSPGSHTSAVKVDATRRGEAGARRTCTRWKQMGELDRWALMAVQLGVYPYSTCVCTISV